MVLQVMRDHNQEERLSGCIEIDDAYLGGERSGKPGHSAEHKFLFVAAVQTNGESHPMRVQLRRVRDFTLAEVSRYAQQAIAPGSLVVHGGLNCFRAFDTATCVHERHITGGGRAGMANPELNWVNTLLSNVKNAMTGTYHAIRGQHAPRYLAEFEYRFNRRYNLKAMLKDTVDKLPREATHRGIQLIAEYAGAVLSDGKCIKFGKRLT